MKVLGNLSEFKNMEVELYRSSDVHNTMVYFGDKNNPSVDYFELLVFKYTYEQKHRVYLRYPNTENFIQLYGEGESSRGIMIHKTVQNIFVREYVSKIDLYKFGENAMIKFGGEFNFLKRFAFCEKVKPIGSHDRLEYQNQKELDKVFEMQYVKIPDDIRTVEYCARTLGDNPIYFLSHYPKYNFDYDNHKFYVIKDNIPSEMKITHMERYRDGGTTYMTLVEEHEGEEVTHTFFSPTAFDKSLTKRWDGIELKNASEEEEAALVKLLNLTLSYENT